MRQRIGQYTVLSPPRTIPSAMRMGPLTGPQASHTVPTVVEKEDVHAKMGACYYESSW